MATVEDVEHTPWKRRAPLVIAATIPVAILLALPWRGHHLPPVPGFPSIWLTLLIGCDLLTVLLLFSQYRAGTSPRLLALSWAYLWSAGGALAIAFAAPGVLSAHPSFAADPNSLTWLWVSRHVLPPALIAVALAPWPAVLERRISHREGRTMRAVASWAVLAALAVAFVSVVAQDPERLPRIVVGSGATRLDGAGTVLIVLFNVLAVVAAVWGVAKRGSNEGLERWAVVASVAFLGDVWLTALFEDRFTIAYYLARVLALGASAFVMLAILWETSQIQAHTKESAQRLEERNSELLEANRLRDHLTAVVSHDLRTPLTGLQGYLELLRDDDLDSPLARRMIERSWTLTRRLTLLTEDLLAAATLEYGDLVVTPEPVDLDQQLGECATSFPDLDLRLECTPGLTAYADPLRLQQILANLVRNAQKHGAEPVVISAGPNTGRAGGVTIRVSDAGPGVPPAFVPRLFDRYTQGPRTATGGSGLGLSVVRDLVVAHSGTIKYDAPSNSFVITLPPPARRALDGRGLGRVYEPATEKRPALLEEQPQP